MRRKIYRTFLVCLLALLIWQFREALSQGGVTVLWTYEKNALFVQDEKRAKIRVAALREKIENIEKSGAYDAVEASRLEDALMILNTQIRFQGDEQNFSTMREWAPGVYWEVWSTQHKSRQLRIKLWRPEQTDAFEKSQLERWKSWPGPVPIPEVSFYKTTLMPLMLGMVLVLALLGFDVLHQHRWQLRKLFSGRLLNVFGWLFTLLISLNTAGTAVAQQLLAKLKKEQQVTSEVVKDGRHTPAVGDPPEGKKTQIIVSTEIFGDTRHDQQQFLVLESPFKKRVSGVAILQNRQSADGLSATSYLGLGVRLKLRWFLFTGTTGPQYEVMKSRLTTQVTFANLRFAIKPLSILSINRVTRGIGRKTVDAHRHIISIRAGPLQQHLAFQTEFLRVRELWRENFWGGVWFAGQLMPKKLKPWLGGFYAYPHYDFSLHNWDIRLGLTKTFTFALK